MIRFHRNPTNGDGAQEQEPAVGELEQGLLALYQVPIPTLKFTPVLEPAGRGARWAAVRRPVFVAGAAGVIAAALLLGPGLLGGGTASVNAEQIFSKASAAANTSAAQVSYHLVATTSAPKGGLDSKSETWSRDAAHTRTQSEDSGVIFNGDQLWLWTNVDGQERAVHAASGASAFAAKETLPGSLAQLLASYGGNSCQTAALDGEATVAGRQAYELTVTPSDSCPKAAAANVAGRKGSLRLWVDKQTFIPLKTEGQDGSGTITYQYEVTEIETGQAIPDSVFEYQPPAGVDVAQVQDVSQAKAALSGAGTSGTTAPTSDADNAKLKASGK